MSIFGETLKNMNPQTAKHAVWIVRIIEPRVTTFTYTDKKTGNRVEAKRFSCLLVSASPVQFMMATVNSFSKKTTPDEAFQKFTHGSVWQITKPYLDPKATQQYNSCPIKAVLVLDAPTTINAVNITETDKENYPARNIVVNEQVGRVCDNLLKKGKMGTAAGTVLVNVCGKMVAKTPMKQVTAGDRTRRVVSIELADDAGNGIEVSVWDAAIDYIESIKVQTGITIIGLSATMPLGENQLKFALWDSGRVMRGGAAADALTASQTQSCNTFRTAKFTPQAPTLTPDQEGFPVCAAALQAAHNSVSLPEQQVIQVNRAAIEIPLSRDQLVTQSGERLYTAGFLRDWSGGVQVDITQDALLYMTGYDSKEKSIALRVYPPPSSRSSSLNYPGSFLEVE